MFGIGTVELAIAGALVAAAVLTGRYLGPGQWTRVDRSTPVGVPASALELPLARLLSDLPGARLLAGGRDTWTLSVHRPAPWTFVPVVLLFPMGLLFLLFREHASLVVTVRPAAGGAEVLVLGTTRRAVHRTIEQAIADLPIAVTPGVDATAER